MHNMDFLDKVFNWCAVVEEVRTVFMELNDTSIYIPSLKELLVH